MTEPLSPGDIYPARIAAAERLMAGQADSRDCEMLQPLLAGKFAFEICPALNRPEAWLDGVAINGGTNHAAR